MFWRLKIYTVQKWTHETNLVATVIIKVLHYNIQ